MLLVAAVFDNGKVLNQLFLALSIVLGVGVSQGIVALGGP